MATCATPGSGLPSCSRLAVSPTTKISGWPGTDKSRLTLTRPARSISTLNHFPACDGATPAVQMTVLLAMRSPATITPSLSIDSTAFPSITSTPNFLSRFRAARESPGANVPRGRWPASTRMIRADLGSTRRKSCFSVLSIMTAIALAISTPVGPAPTRTNVNRCRCNMGSSSASAISKAVSILFLIATASARFFNPGAYFSYSLWPK